MRDVVRSHRLRLKAAPVRIFVPILVEHASSSELGLTDNAAA